MHKVHHLGQKGLHLNAHGTSRIVMNIISLIKRFQQLPKQINSQWNINAHANSSIYFGSTFFASSHGRRDDITKSKHVKCSINDISKSNLNPNTKPFIYMGDNRPVDLLVKRVGIPKYIGNATSPITPPLFNSLPKSSPNDDCVFVAIFATSLLLSVLIIGHVVSITWDNEYNYIYPQFYP